MSQTIRSGVATPKRHSKRPWILWILFVLAGAGYWFIFHSQYFIATTVKVQGNQRVAAEQISAIAAVALNQPLIKLPSEDISTVISTIAEVKSVSVERGWPHTVLITVTERQPIAVANDGTQLVLVDDAGIAASGAIPEVPKGMLVVAGAPSTTAMQAAVAVIAGLPKDWKVTGIDAPTQDSVTVHLDGGINVTFGSGADIDQKVKVAAALMANKYTAINVSSPDAPTVTK